MDRQNSRGQPQQVRKNDSALYWEISSRITCRKSAFFFFYSRKVLFDWRQLTVTLAKWHASTWYFLWDEQALKLIINLKWFCGMLRLNVDGWCHCRAYTELCQPGNNCVNSSRVFRWKVCPFYEFLLWTIRRHCIKFPTCLAQLKLKYLFWFRKV